MKKLILFTYLFISCNFLYAILLIQGTKQDGSTINANASLTFQDECNFHSMVQAETYKWEFKIYCYNEMTEDTITQTYYESNEKNFYFKITKFTRPSGYYWVYKKKESEYYSSPIKAEVSLTMRDKDGIQITQLMPIFLNLRPVSATEIQVVNRSPLGLDGFYDWCTLKFVNEEQHATQIIAWFSNEDGITEYEILKNPWYVDYSVNGTNDFYWIVQYMIRNSYGWVLSKEYDLYELLSQYDPTSIKYEDATAESFIVSSYINDNLYLRSEAYHDNDIIRIYSTTGKETVHASFNGQRSINLSFYPEGIYLLQILRDNYCIYQDKIILKY